SCVFNPCALFAVDFPLPPPHIFVPLWLRFSKESPQIHSERIEKVRSEAGTVVLLISLAPSGSLRGVGFQRHPCIVSSLGYRAAELSVLTLLCVSQLQDTLLQKEEELARLQEENNHLRQFLNSALVKQLEEKTKKLLRQSNQKSHSPLQSGKRRLRAEGLPLPREASHPQKARRNLLGSFSACEEPRDPHVDSWVLRTLGLKDLDTIDESPASANYSALTPELPLRSFIEVPPEATNFGCNESQPAVYRCATSLSTDRTGAMREEPVAHAPDLPCHFSLPENNYPPLPCGLPCCSDASPTPTDVAFTTSLSPHCNVKTHTFRQGQAFVRRDEDGGWKLTWVPKQPE
uniref:Geminin coiled-coil domain containing n=1 Tax=Podarcis muralis TaxID=64176 RepID=A0A670KJF3_PODMU